MESSLLGHKEYFFRHEVIWKPFCKGNSSVHTDVSKTSSYRKPVERVKGENAISCSYEVFHKRKEDQEPKLYTTYKLKIDFDTNTSTLCFLDGCREVLTDFPCKVVED